MSRRLSWLSLTVLLFLGGAHYAFAQESPAQTAALDAITRGKVINSALFLIAVCWFLWKYAPAFFNARSADIQRAIQEATGLKMEAEFRYSEIDRRMASLAEEVKKLREQGASEIEREHQRFRHETELEIEHIRHNVTAEMEAFRQEGVYQIRQRTTQLALTLAERNLQERFRSGEPEDLIGDFVHLVEQGKN